MKFSTQLEHFGILKFDLAHLLVNSLLSWCDFGQLDRNGRTSAKKKFLMVNRFLD